MILTEAASITKLNELNPHFSQGFYCDVTEDYVYCVSLNRTPRHTVKYACGVLNRAPCIHSPLDHLATKPCEKCGLNPVL